MRGHAAAMAHAPNGHVRRLTGRLFRVVRALVAGTLHSYVVTLTAFSRYVFITNEMLTRYRYTVTPGYTRILSHTV